MQSSQPPPEVPPPEVPPPVVPLDGAGGAVYSGAGAGAGAGAGGTKGAIAASVDGVGAGTSDVVAGGGGGVVVVLVGAAVVVVVVFLAVVVEVLVGGGGVDVELVRFRSDTEVAGAGVSAPPVSMTPNATRLTMTAVRLLGIRAQPMWPRRSAITPMTSAINPTSIKKVATNSPEVSNREAISRQIQSRRYGLNVRSVPFWVACPHDFVGGFVSVERFDYR